MTPCAQVFFVESICNDPEIIAENIKVRRSPSEYSYLYVKVLRVLCNLPSSASKIWESRLCGLWCGWSHARLHPAHRVLQVQLHAYRWWEGQVLTSFLDFFLFLHSSFMAQFDFWFWTGSSPTSRSSMWAVDTWWTASRTTSRAG